jgi:hypothetical protein
MRSSVPLQEFLFLGHQIIASPANPMKVEILKDLTPAYHHNRRDPIRRRGEHIRKCTSPLLFGLTHVTEFRDSHPK